MVGYGGSNDPKLAIFRWESNAWCWVGSGPKENPDLWVRLQHVDLLDGGHGFRGGIPVSMHYGQDARAQDDGALFVAERFPIFWAEHMLARKKTKENLKGSQAPALEASQWFNTNAPLSLADLHGKVVLLDFWGQWCGPCVEKLPLTEALHAKFKDRGLLVIGVHSAHGSDNLASFLQKKAVSFPVPLDTGETAERYAVEAWPSYFLIDKAGKLVWGPSHDLPSERRIEELISELPAPRAADIGVQAKLSFGPVITRVIQSAETGTNLFLDLDSGQLLTPPKEIRALFNEPYLQRVSWERDSDPRAVKMRDWLQSSGANLMLSDGTRGLERLEMREGFATAPRVISNDVVVAFGFDEADPNYLVTRIRPMLESPSVIPILQLQPGFDSELNTRWDSFCFRTREGAIGILQILNPEDNPRGVRIRYKLLQTIP
jgi:thiol-disulfide isomerase/thioredoxin